MSEHLHSDGAADWDISAEVLATLQRELRPGMTTLETGAGRSTLVFAQAGCTHHCVTPSQAEVARIRAYCATHAISLERTQFHVGFSQDVLPALAVRDLDFVLIDGGHGFPIPALDWQFTAPRMKVGALLILDDVDLWTGAMVVDFLKGEPGWRYEGLLRGRSAVFRLTAPFSAHEWTNQPAVVAKSRFSQLRRKAVNALGLLATGQFKALAGKVENERRLAAAARQDY